MSDKCPSGFAWDEVVQDCLPCSLCEDFPDTSICQTCSDSAGSDNDALPVAAVVGIVVSCVVVMMPAILFLVYRIRKCWKDRDVTTHPVQVATDPEPDSEVLIRPHHDNRQ